MNNNSELLDKKINLEEYGGNADSITVKQLLDFYINERTKKKLKESYGIEEGQEITGTFDNLAFKKLLTSRFTISGLSAMEAGLANEGQIQFGTIFQSTTDKVDGYLVTINSKWEPTLPTADGQFVYDVNVKPIGDAKIEEAYAYGRVGTTTKMYRKEITPVTFEEILRRNQEIMGIQPEEEQMQR